MLSSNAFLGNKGELSCYCRKYNEHITQMHVNTPSISFLCWNEMEAKMCVSVCVCARVSVHSDYHNVKQLL